MEIIHLLGINFYKKDDQYIAEVGSNENEGNTTFLTEAEYNYLKDLWEKLVEREPIQLDFDDFEESLDLKEINDEDWNDELDKDEYEDTSFSITDEDIIHKLFDSNTEGDSKYFERAASIINDWYSLEFDDFGDFNSKEEALDFIEDDIYDMLDAATNEGKRDIVAKALGVTTYDYDDNLEADF